MERQRAQGSHRERRIQRENYTRRIEPEKRLGLKVKVEIEKSG